MLRVAAPPAGGLLGVLLLARPDRLARENAIARHIEEIVDVDSERVRSLPSEAECELFEEEFKKFAAFADDCGVGALPATGHTVAFYLMELLASGASLNDIADATAGIKHVHEMAQQYLDWAPIHAALEFAIQERNPGTGNARLA
jgi:hypothetical protein